TRVFPLEIQFAAFLGARATVRSYASSAESNCCKLKYKSPFADQAPTSCGSSSRAWSYAESASSYFLKELSIEPRSFHDSTDGEAPNLRSICLRSSSSPTRISSTPRLPVETSEDELTGLCSCSISAICRRAWPSVWSS